MRKRIIGMIVAGCVMTSLVGMESWESEEFAGMRGIPLGIEVEGGNAAVISKLLDSQQLDYKTFQALFIRALDLHYYGKQGSLKYLDTAACLYDYFVRAKGNINRVLRSLKEFKFQKSITFPVKEVSLFRNESTYKTNIQIDDTQFELSQDQREYWRVRVGEGEDAKSYFLLNKNKGKTIFREHKHAYLLPARLFPLFYVLTRLNQATRLITFTNPVAFKIYCSGEEGAQVPKLDDDADEWQRVREDSGTGCVQEDDGGETAGAALLKEGETEEQAEGEEGWFPWSWLGY